MNETAASGDQSVVCTGCSLLCDDIRRIVQPGESFRLENLCYRGRDYYARLLDQKREGAVPQIDGIPVSIEQAIEAMVSQLVRSRFPLICGLSDQSTECQLAAIRLARQSGAAIDWTSSHSPVAWHQALQVTGRVSCSLGELQELADLVVVWAPIRNPLTRDYWNGSQEICW